MKKLRPILAVSLLVQSLTFFVLNIEKKKNLAKAFAAIGVAGGAAGAYLLATKLKSRKYCCEAGDCDDFDEFDDLDDLDVCEDDILCSFEDENAEKAEESTENA